MTFGQALTILDDRTGSDGTRVFFFRDGEEARYGQWRQGKTFLGNAFCDAGEWRTGYGGVRVFSGHLDPASLFEIVVAMNQARNEGFFAGQADAQSTIRKALGL